MADNSVVYTVVIENWNQKGSLHSFCDRLETEYVSTIIENIRNENFNQCRIESNSWGEAYISLGEDENGVWASPRYFKGSDEHGNGGEIPLDAQDIILRITEEFTKE